MRALQGKVALVVGGTRGTGGAISRRLAVNGAAVAIICLSRSGDADAMESELRGSGAAIHMIQADVIDASVLTDAIGEVVSHFGRPGVLVNVAGTAIVGPLESYADDAFDRIFALNVSASFLAAKATSREMREGGRIITIGSIVADRMSGPAGLLRRQQVCAGRLDPGSGARARRTWDHCGSHPAWPHRHRAEPGGGS